MWKKKIGVLTMAAGLFLLICTFRAFSCERSRVVMVQTVRPELTKEREWRLPGEAVDDASGLWIAEKEETIWGTELRAVRKCVEVTRKTKDWVFVSGLPAGTETEVILSSEKELEEGCEVIYGII